VKGLDDLVVVVFDGAAGVATEPDTIYDRDD
jgi:hypothetical protein